MSNTAEDVDPLDFSKQKTQPVKRRRTYLHIGIAIGAVAFAASVCLIVPLGIWAYVNSAVLIAPSVVGRWEGQGAVVDFYSDGKGVLRWERGPEPFEYRIEGYGEKRLLIIAHKENGIQRKFSYRRENNMLVLISADRNAIRMAGDGLALRKTD